ncbi:MAG: AmmeMemoRadiSam system protein B [Deltaproteobacteria bacterium]|nr:AmmeMemoRadiSam system protein B [Deltaproteobacteria bacterium]
MADAPLPVMEYPKLRPVEAFPVEAEGGETAVALRDPLNLSDGVLMVRAPALFILQHFDGQHSLLDIQAAFARRFGQLLFTEQLAELIRTLDAHLMLESEHFHEARQRIEEAFRQAPVRPPIHAGKSYETAEERLRAQLADYFTHAEGPGRPGAFQPTPPLRGAIIPHIDFLRGGFCYAWAYREIAERCDADLFIILGTCHAATQTPFILTRKPYATPLGTLPTDLEAVATIEERYPGDLYREEFAHRGEHSIEFQSVFLNYLYQGKRQVTVVPLLCGSFHEQVMAGRDPLDTPEVARMIGALQALTARPDRRVCVLASVDLAHMGPRYGDAEPVTPDLLRWLAAEDRESLDAVVQVDARAFFRSVAKDQDRRKICGLSPIYTLLAVLEGGRGKLLKYAQWPDEQATVTFASTAFS